MRHRHVLVFLADDDELVVVVGTYVDDLLATGASAAAVERLFEGLKTLQMKDVGRVHKFLGIRVELAENGGYRIDQE